MAGSGDCCTEVACEVSAWCFQVAVRPEESDVDLAGLARSVVVEIHARNVASYTLCNLEMQEHLNGSVGCDSLINRQYPCGAKPSVLDDRVGLRHRELLRCCGQAVRMSRVFAPLSGAAVCRARLLCVGSERPGLGAHALRSVLSTPMTIRWAARRLGSSTTTDD